MSPLSESEPSTSAQLHQIGEVAEAVGLSLRTIRYYEEVGIVVPSGRSSGGFRLYTGDDIERLALVKAFKPLEFSLDEMRDLLELRDRLAAGELLADGDAARFALYAEAVASRSEKLHEQLAAADALAQRLGREAETARRRVRPFPTIMTRSEIVGEAARRRTFAIISHPDAGKTTLTEKLLLYSGVIGIAGSVRARHGRRASRSDWMALERQRGISVSSTVLRFERDGMVFNLLDTPGHEDFSEDTYRVLAAADAAVMVIDAAKGVEARTRTLFEVARRRGIPVVTFVNKCDRPGLDAIEILDNIERELGVRPTPLTWPVGYFGDLRGVIDRATGTYDRFQRSAGGSTIAPVEHLDDQGGAERDGVEWTRAVEELELLDATGCVHDPGSYRALTSTPTLFGSAITNFGVGALLDALVTLVPAPDPPETTDGTLRPLDAAFAGLVFKIQSNMDPAHRDHVAFVRVATGCFERGMTLKRSSNGRQLTTKFAHTMLGNERDTVELAYPGDIVGIVSPGGLEIGETLYDGPAVRFPPIPAFTPELFARVGSGDVSRHKQLRRGLDQLAAEGVVQLFHDGPQGPLTIAGAVGPLQFEVATFRLADEFGAPAVFEAMPVHHARRVDDDSASLLADQYGVRILVRADQARLAVFESEFSLSRARRDHPELFAEVAVI